MDAAAKMGAEEGKKVWGAEWRKIVARVRSGAVWDEAIAAYGGEGRIDGDVINALYVTVLPPPPFFLPVRRRETDANYSRGWLE